MDQTNKAGIILHSVISYYMREAATLQQVRTIKTYQRAVHQ